MEDFVVERIRKRKFNTDDAIFFDFTPFRGDSYFTGEAYLIPNYFKPILSRANVMVHSLKRNAMEQYTFFQDLEGIKPTSILVEFSKDGRILRTPGDYVKEISERYDLVSSPCIGLRHAELNGFTKITGFKHSFLPQNAVYSMSEEAFISLKSRKDAQDIYGHLVLDDGNDMILPISCVLYDPRYPFYLEFNPDGSLISAKQYQRYSESQKPEEKPEKPSVTQRKIVRVKPVRISPK